MATSHPPLHLFISDGAERGVVKRWSGKWGKYAREIFPFSITWGIFSIIWSLQKSFIGYVAPQAINIRRILTSAHDWFVEYQWIGWFDHPTSVNFRKSISLNRPSRLMESLNHANFDQTFWFALDSPFIYLIEYWFSLFFESVIHVLDFDILIFKSSVVKITECNRIFIDNSIQAI